MRTNFKITGFFYENGNYQFRKYLNIKRINSENDSPDLMVIMMNPGSSKPKDGINNNISESEAIPDATQSQIMHLMQKCDFKYARILNLSDLREGSSKRFYSKVAELEQMGIVHSIFDNSRENELNELLNRNVPIVFAWGVNSNLSILAEKAIKTIGPSKIFGFKKAGNNYAYYHPLPQIQNKQKEWIEKMAEIILNHKEK